MCEYCEGLKYIVDTLTPSSGFRMAVLEHGRNYGTMRMTGKTCATLLVNYSTPNGNGMMGDYAAINYCPMCGRKLRGDTE